MVLVSRLPSVAACGQRGAGEAELGCFLKPLIHMAHGPDRAGQADLAEIDGVLRRGLAAERGDESAAAAARSAAGSLSRRPPATLR